MLSSVNFDHLKLFRPSAHTPGLRNVAEELQVIEVHCGQNIIS